ncbi:MAG: TIGR00266 family protein [Methanobacteriota archaeon]
MKYEIKYRPSYGYLVVTLEPGESITAEAGAMTYMQPSIEVHTRKRKQGLLSTIGMSLLGGQSFFVNDFTATSAPGEAGFSAAPLGDVEVIDIGPGKGFIIQKSAYIASEQGVTLDVEWQGFSKGIFGQGLFMIKVSGQGMIFINTFGAIDKHTLAPGERLIVDNFHLVAFSDTCQYKVTKFGGWKETFLSGEFLVTDITGPGEVYIQTKNIREMADWIWALIEPKVQAKAR